MKKIFQPATLLLLGAFTVLVTGCSCAKPNPNPPLEVKAAKWLGLYGHAS